MGWKKEDYSLIMEEFKKSKSKIIEKFYDKYDNQIKIMTNEEKEDLLVRLVSEGEISYDVAIEISKRERIDVD